MSYLGDKIRELRQQKPMKVREFADALGKSPGYISRIEARDEIPSPELLCTIAETLDVDAEELLGLAKECQLRQAQEQIEKRQSSALSLYRKSRKD